MMQYSRRFTGRMSTVASSRLASSLRKLSSPATALATSSVRRSLATSSSGSSASHLFRMEADEVHQHRHDEDQGHHFSLSPSSPVPPKPHDPDYPHRLSPMAPHDISPRRTVPDFISKPNYAYTGRVVQNNATLMFSDNILLHNPANVERMTKAARLARRMLNYACGLVQEGVTTDEIDARVHEEIIQHHAYPSPLNYSGFPKSLCTSVNEVICHGIPDSRPLQFGDVVSLDVSCYLNGVHGDNCATVVVGDFQDTEGEAGCDWRGVPYRMDFDSQEQEKRILAARRLVHATRESLYAGIAACTPNGCLSNVGNAIHAVADAYGYETVQKYRGHGISHEFHCPPFVKHFRNNDQVRLVPGMIFTIEPMLTEGSWDCREWDDEWTVVTLDGGLSAQFEHTVLITDTGVEILTVTD